MRAQQTFGNHKIHQCLGRICKKKLIHQLQTFLSPQNCRPVSLLQRSSHWLLSTPHKKKNIQVGVRAGFFVFLLKVGRGWSCFVPKKTEKDLATFWCFFLFWRLFEVGFWRHQQLISRMDEEDLICNMSTTKSTKRSLALQEMIYQICEVLVTVSESWQEKPLLFTIFQAEISF